MTAAQVDLLSALDAAGIPVDETDRVTGLINAVVGTVPAGLLDDLAAADGVAHVTPDRRVHALTTDSVPSTGAPAAWDRTDAAGTPLRGAGVTVAIIDRGIDYAIADLGGGFGDGFRSSTATTSSTTTPTRWTTITTAPTSRASSPDRAPSQSRAWHPRPR